MGISITNQAEQISAYVHNTRVSSAKAVALVRQLEASAPGDLSPQERSALQWMKEVADEVSNVGEARVRSAPSSLREPRNAMSGAVTALHDGLRTIATVPAHVGPEGEEAARIIDVVFPEGTVFIRLDAMGLWNGVRLVLERIDGAGLAVRIDALLSPSLLRTVRMGFERLTRAIKATGTTAPAVPKTALQEANAKFSFALAQYARTLSVAVRHDDEASMARFVAALAPIDGARVTPGDADEDDDELDTIEPAPTDTPAAPIPPGLPGADPFVRS